MYTKIKTSSEIESMRIAGAICSQILGLLCRSVKSGMSTKQLASIAADKIQKNQVQASFLDYNGFPEVICISVNDEVVHGIPKKTKILKNGDIVSFDLGITYKGMIVDSARSVIVGSGDKKLHKLLNATKDSLDAGIEQIKHNCHVGDISEAVETELKRHKYGVIKDLVGHGVGHLVHEEPNIPNFGKKGAGPLLKAGMTVAIEPMATMGSHNVFIDNDGWTVKTRDGSLAAHFEHTVLITKEGREVLTSVR